MTQEETSEGQREDKKRKNYDKEYNTMVRERYIPSKLLFFKKKKIFLRKGPTAKRRTKNEVVTRVSMRPFLFTLSFFFFFSDHGFCFWKCQTARE